MPGLTPEQRTLLETRRCQMGHRIDDVNYPTPEGDCPLCIRPDLTYEVAAYQRLVIERPRAELHPAVRTNG